MKSKMIPPKNTKPISFNLNLIYLTLYSILFIFLFNSYLNAQGFCQRLGGGNPDRANKIAIAPSGELYVVGTTESFGAGSQDIYVVKMKNDGSIIWTRTIGGPYIDTGNNIAIDGNGNLYVVGTTVSYGAGIFDLYIIKLNANGDTLWTRTLGGSSDDYGYGIALDNNGNIYVTGYTINFGAGSQDIYLAKLNPSGSLLWTKTIGGSYAEYGYDVTTDDAGNVYVVGSTGSIIPETQKPTSLNGIATEHDNGHLVLAETTMMKPLQ